MDAKELIKEFTYGCRECDNAKQSALIAVKIKYNALREQLFNLRACGVINSAQTYISRLDSLNAEQLTIENELNPF